MTNSFSSDQPLGPLSVGNVVSAALKIYRDRFAVYYKLAFRAYLWVIIPIYGWAKFAMISGLIARLAYGEVIEKPETVKEARRHVNPRLWTFFFAGLLVIVILFLSIIIYVIISSIAVGTIGALSQVLLNNLTWLGFIIIGLLSILGAVLFLGGLTWLFSRLSLAEMPICIEDISSPTQAINRSWKLTKGLVVRLMSIFFIAFLITFPISGVIQISISVLQVTLSLIFPPDSAFFGVIYFVLVLMINFAAGALFVPFWQGIKAALYYDLRSRQEGIDLNLRES